MKEIILRCVPQLKHQQENTSQSLVDKKYVPKFKSFLGRQYPQQNIDE